MSSKNISNEDFSKILENSYTTNVSKSIRRVFFNATSKIAEEEGRWHIDIMSGMGTCIIIKYDNRFFAISAKHVFKDLKDHNGNFLNASPFWIPMEFHTKWEKIDDFFMPKKFWNIGELINRDEIILTNDIIMIELYPPYLEVFPDYYFNLDEDEDLFSKEEDFFDGRYLQISGYPFCKNYFDWDIEHKDTTMTHGTSIIRHTAIGIYNNDDSLGYISFKNTEGETTHENSNGMSGGIVYDLQPEPEKTKLCGMILNIGNDLCRFIPSYIMIEAIKNYKNASSEIIDPAEYSVTEPTDKKGMETLNMLYKALTTKPKC